MFKLFEKVKSEKVNRYIGEIHATQDGVAIPLAEVPDRVISEGILGEGMAIIPQNGKVVSPVDGTVICVATSGHAFGIQTSDGVDVLVHIGVDTVNLDGQGFQVYAKEGDYVLAGTPICFVDLSLLAKRNIPSHTATLISNSASFADIIPVTGEVVAGISKVIKYRTEV